VLRECYKMRVLGGSPGAGGAERVAAESSGR